MFDKFTDRARRGLVLARQHAVESRAPEITCTHLLAALCGEQASLASTVLNDFQITKNKIVSLIVNHRLASYPIGAKVPYSSLLREALDSAYSLAQRYNGIPYVAPEHLLLALIGLNPMKVIFASLGVNIEHLEKLTQALWKLMREQNGFSVFDPEADLSPNLALEARIKTLTEANEQLTKQLEENLLDPESGNDVRDELLDIRRRWELREIELMRVHTLLAESRKALRRLERKGVITELPPEEDEGVVIPVTHKDFCMVTVNRKSGATFSIEYPVVDGCIHLTPGDSVSLIRRPYTGEKKTPIQRIT